MLSATRSFLLSCLQCSVLSYSVLSRIVLIRITCSENELRNPRTTVRVLTVCFLKDLPVACHRSGAKTSKIDAGGTLSTEQDYLYNGARKSIWNLSITIYRHSTQMSLSLIAILHCSLA